MTTRRFDRYRARAKLPSFSTVGELTVFLDDPTVPLDNDRSEAALRVVALGRKIVPVGNEDAGDNIAGPYSLVATREASTPLNTCVTCCSASALTRPIASTCCFPIAGMLQNHPT